MGLFFLQSNPRTFVSLDFTNFLITRRNPTMSSSTWACKKCTFLNSPSQSSTCQMCLTQSSSSPSSKPSSSVPTWSCKACTFLNPYNNTNCELCNTRAPVSSLSSFEDLADTGLDSELDSSVGSVFFPLKACSSSKRKIRDQDFDKSCRAFDEFRGVKQLKNVVTVKEDSKSGPSAASSHSGAVFSSLKILSYNVWFREDLEMHSRMKAIGDLIQLHSPDFICFQEVTPNICNVLCQSSWWKGYQCSVSSEVGNSSAYFCMQLSKLPVKSFSCKPFRNSIMGRELCLAEVEVQGDKPLVVATSHLESPCPSPPTWDQMFSKERVEQAKEAIKLLQKNPNVIFCGDMNWDDKLDGQFPYPDGWVDAWTELRPGENGWTYDTKSNQMLSGNRTLQKRLDRFICNLRDFKITKIDMIGKEAIPGLSYCKEKKVRKEIKKLELPVLPSDHYGLLLTICRQ
ncbi:tyrosyl-DNA phosphodiesterase 2 [Melia azedarach]|uniref:Tyrosyl-DNA phosphodiesterase 2 n=1 Tax=Melia azedarach TaxID=155640 RepID=A0ACC1WXD1_MELAZ|nr:tyrosyl-DNA phosphodiesterase 2 [Melia azedarach]